MLRKPYVTLSHQPRIFEVMGGHSKAVPFAEYTLYFILAPNIQKLGLLQSTLCTSFWHQIVKGM